MRDLVAEFSLTNVHEADRCQGQWCIIHNPLIPLEDGDDRHDAQVKYDILRNDILPSFHVLGVVDDRARVVQMWQSAGIRTMDCGQGVSDF